MQIIDLIENVDVIKFAFWGGIGAVANVILSYYMIFTKNEKEKNKQIKRVVYFIVNIFVSAFIGSVFAIIMNHNISIAILTGFFSQSIGIILIKYQKSKNFNKFIKNAINKKIDL